MLPLLVACNDEDDIDAIFMGRTWKLSRIMLNKSTSALSPEEQEKVSKSADNCFIVSFSGESFSGRTLNETFGGTWTVDGKNQAISFTFKGNIPHPTDMASQKMLEILQNANKYGGDTRNLEIRRADDSSFLLFYPLN